VQPLASSSFSWLIASSSGDITRMKSPCKIKALKLYYRSAICNGRW
jgi:hypothetical protein